MVHLITDCFRSLIFSGAAVPDWTKALAVSHATVSYDVIISFYYKLLSNGFNTTIFLFLLFYTTISELRDDDIKDDIKCVKRIFRQTQHLTGNGFNAW